MIKLSSRPGCPRVLKSTKVTKARSSLNKKVQEGQKLSNSDFQGKSYWRETKQTLHEYQNGKCCYCERRRDANAEADVEHFRPKLGVTENSKHPGYWWLAYEWSNLLFVCKSCNSDHKKNHFPLLQETDRVSTPADLSPEKPVLIDPSLEDPADFIDYDWESIPGKVLLVGKDGEDRGRQTVKILALDIRDDLNKSRFDALTTLQFAERVLRSASPHQAVYQNAVERLQQKADAHQECLGFVRCYISRRGLQEFIK